MSRFSSTRLAQALTMTSLTRKFLLGVGVMTVAVTTLAAIAGFLVFEHELEQRQIDHLRAYVEERSRNEDHRFSNLVATHRAAAEAVEVRARSLTPAQAAARFDRYFPLQADGTRRTVPSAFDGDWRPDGDFVYGMGAFLADGRAMGPGEKALWVSAFEVVSHTGETLKGEYDNFYFFTPQNRMVMFGPNRPDRLMFYRHDAPASLDFSGEQMVQLTRPTANPERRTRCTNLQRLIQVNRGDRLATACVTPMDVAGRHVGAFGSSIDLTGYFMNAIGHALPKASNLIVTSTGDLIAYPGFATAGVASETAVARYERTLRLRALVASIQRQHHASGVVHSPDGGQLVAFGRLTGPDWYFLVSYPKSAVAWSAAASASWVLLIGLLAAALETALMVLMARRLVAQPLTRLVESTQAERGSATACSEALERRDDEIGLLARTLRASREQVDEVLSSLEQRVRERTAELELANQEKSRFLANMSHELRTPLNGVVAVSEVLAREQATPRTRELAELIVSSGRLLERVLSDILDVSKIEAGQMRLEPDDFDLVRLVHRIAELHRAAAEARGLQLDWSVEPAAAGVYRGDPVRLTQVLSNLLSNSVKFTEAGHVRLSVAAIPEGLEFCVADTGIGFDAETGARLFGRFEQADASITRRFGGTGLGLAICRSLSELMGGRIVAESEPGEGSVFTVVLPLPRVADSAPDAAAEEPGATGDIDGQVHVLLAEDHPANQRVVQLMLEPLGARIVIAENGRQALDRLMADSFDVVLMDMQMPVMDGLTATAAFRAWEAASGRARTPVIMLTANALDEHVAASAAAGADRHLSKPIRIDALIQAISEVLAPVEPEAVAESAQPGGRIA